MSQSNVLVLEGRVVTVGTKHININQYYPTTCKELFSEDVVREDVKHKWESYLNQFNTGELKGYVLNQMNEFINTGWMYLLIREIAHRKDSLWNIDGTCLDNAFQDFPPFSWVVWGDTWVYGGIEDGGDYRVVSLPLNYHSFKALQN